MKRFAFLATSLVAFACIVSSASATVTTNWYTTNCYGPSVDCWVDNSTGVSQADVVNNGYLPSHTFNFNSTFPAQTEGDGCFIAGNSPPLIAAQPGGPGYWTGFNPDNPLSGYQKTDSTAYPYSTSCQAENTEWGFLINTGDGAGWANNSSGMGLSAFFGLGGNQADRPFNYPAGNNCSFGLPSPCMALTTNLDVNFTNAGDWHGFLCPTLLDTTTATKLEYCFEDWRSDNFSGGQGPCQPGGWYCTYDPQGGFTESAGPGDGGYEVWTRFAPGTIYGTDSAGWYGSVNTQLNNYHGNENYLGLVTYQQFQRALQGIDTIPGAHISTNPVDYELYQIQDGFEGSGPAIGGNVRNLIVNTQH